LALCEVIYLLTYRKRGERITIREMVSHLGRGANRGADDFVTR